uniref:ATP-dependent zinc metalloprotease FtsH n=1 Tax=Raphidocelis subcapitata TaxID=307507 RepID=A0A2Z6FBK8_9CHLO|nr:ATP-dependent zinc metalloprotease FtsH [Raphidocelis subcapitata]
MNLKNQLPKRFSKKNLLLQQDLEGFLSWRQKQEKNFESMSRKQTDYSVNSFTNNNKNLYKPIRFNFFKTLGANELFFLNFFSTNKPFMKFWFFPLLGVVFLTLLNSQDKHSNSVEKYPNSKASLFVKNDFLSPISSLNLDSLENRSLSSSSRVFLGPEGTYSYKNSKTSFNNKTRSLNEIEQMCSFYLKQTTTKLNPFSQDSLQTENVRDFIFNKMWFEPVRLRNSHFDWIWYSLKIPNQTLSKKLSFKNNQVFSQKLKNMDWVWEPKEIGDSFDSKSMAALNRPNIAYIEASLFLDNWVKRASFLTAFEMTQNKLDRIEISDLILNDFEKTKGVTKSSRLISHLFSLFNFIQQNQSIIKNIDFKINSLGTIKANFVNDFKENCLKKYQTDFLKLWFKHYLQNQNLNVKIDSKNESMRKNRVRFLKQNTSKTGFSIDKLFKETIFLNKYQSQEQKKVFTQFQKLNILKINLLKFRKVKPSLHPNFDLIDQKLYSKTYELMLLKNWNLMLKPGMKSCLLLPVKGSHRPTTAMLERAKLRPEGNLMNDQKDIQYVTSLKDLEQVLDELKVYRRFSQLSSRIFGLQREFKENSLAQLAKFEKSRFIFSYNNPILKGCSILPVSQSRSRSRTTSASRPTDVVRERSSASFAMALSQADVLSFSILKNDFNRLQNKEFEILKKQLILKPQYRLKQSLFSNSKDFFVTPVFVDDVVRHQIDKTVNEQANSKANKTLLGFCQQSLAQFLSFSELLDRNFLKNFQNLTPVNKDFLKTELLNLKQKKVFISKSFKLENRKTFILTDSTMAEKSAINRTKKFYQRNGMKQKLNWTPDLVGFSGDRRKTEKIFRTYNSIKFPKPQNRSKFLQILNNTSKLNYPEGTIEKKRRVTFELSLLRKILTQFKQKIQQKRIFEHSKFNNFTYQEITQNHLVLKKPTLLYLNQLLVKRDQNPGSTNKMLNSIKLSKNLIRLNFLKKADFLNNSFESIRFESQKRLEKKRRLKKLKLENRRRKKRKRFYPRPSALRFQLHASFIKNRYHPFRKIHFLAKSPKTRPQILNEDSSQMNVSEHFFKDSLNPQLKDNFFIEKNSTKKLIYKQSFNEKIYRLKKQRWGNVLTNVSEKDLFQRMVLGLNQHTYHHSEFYKISNDILADFEKLCWKSYWLRSNIKPYIHRVQNNLKRIKLFEHLKSDNSAFNFLFEQSTKSITDSRRESLGFLKKRPGKKTRFRQVSSYPNVKATLETGWNNLDTTNFFKILEKKTEYDTLIYQRLRDQIKNVKSQLNVNGENQARSYKTGRQKFEVAFNTNPFSTLSSFRKTVFDPAINNLPFFSLSNDNLIKPFGDMPTLRILWACHQTNLLTYHDTNFLKTLWSTYKYREQLKSNKTRKFLLKIFNIYGNWTSSTELHKNLKTMTQTKTNFISQKTQTLLGPINGENSSSFKTRLRKIKFRLQAKPLFQKTEQEQAPPIWFETPLQGKLQKSMGHFWWSTKQKNNIETPFPVFFSTPSSFLDLNQYLFSRNTFNFKPIYDYSLFQFDDFDFNQSFVFTAFWFSCLFLHLSLFFALIRIPEIRNLLKFQLLILSKLGNTYLTAIFWIYKLLSTYKNKLTRFAQQSTFLSALSRSEARGLRRSARTSARGKPGKALTAIKYETAMVSNKPQTESIFQRNQKGSQVQRSSSVLSLISKRLMSDPEVRFKIRQTLDRSLVTNFRCRLFFTFIEIYLVETKKQKLEPFIGLGKKSSFLLFSVRDCFYQEVRQKSWKSSFIKDKSITQAKNYIYSFFNGWQWYVSNQKSASILNQTKTKLLKPFISDAEQWVGNFLQHKKNGFSFWKDSNIQFQSMLSLLILYSTKIFVHMFYLSFIIFYKVLFSIVDCLESFLLVFYKFFEKPAELMVTWIADFFLVEWSSDLINYVPDAFDRDISISFFKFSRSSRLVLPVPFAFFLQRMLLSSSEIFYRWLLKPDSDLIIRQKKGIVFWDIWSEILILAAEQYKMNLSSLSTIKEEQELLIENLLRDKIVSEQSFEKSNSVSFDLPTTSILERSKSFLPTPKQSFFTSHRWIQSFEKLEPLLRFLKTHPSTPNYAARTMSYSTKTFANPRKQLSFQLFGQFHNIDLSILDSQLPIKSNTAVRQNFVRGRDSNDKNPARQADEVIFDWIKSETSQRWSVNQALTTQGRDTDLFMDINPPKSFLHVGFLKNYLAPQEILGSLVCEIYSGQFPMKISKNILIVGAPGRAKSFFIQALAGETESKIVIDNGHRYTFVNGGVPVGMKLLREVFDSIALHTPCLFLLEDIHVIGERRPMLISDDEISKSKTDTFGAEQEEVHEKDRSVYQLSRHALSHYNRPYKGDFSLSIPTNHFCYDLFLGVSPTRKRLSHSTAQTPLPLTTIEQNLAGQQKTEKDSFFRGSLTQNFQQSNLLISFLQLSIDQVFAPPITSPFNILLMKEQKKLKPKKIVKEMPWSGFSHDQLMLLSKTSYSIRVKVAMLAELSMTNLSMKLDMITDLLVIIDSVRSNRGFVVFATTHLPALLDPALRRPGRLDETISLPILPNLMSRFEIFKLRTSFHDEPFDFFDYSLLTSSTNENEIEEFISKGMLLLLNTKRTNKKRTASIFYSNFVKDYSIYSLSQAFRSVLFPNSVFVNAFRSVKSLDLKTTKNCSNRSENQLSQVFPTVLFSSNDKLPYLSLTYSKAGRFLIEALLLFDHSIYSTEFFQSSKVSESFKVEESAFKMLYSSQSERTNTFLKLFAGKMSEFFVFNSSQSLLKKSKNKITDRACLLNPSQGGLFDTLNTSDTYWKSALSFLDSFFQKRYLHNKNLIASKLLFFENCNTLRQPPSPPNSAILMPAKKFENYKRTLRDFTQKPIFTINEKIQSHQQQRFLKLLYKVPLKSSFRTISNSNSMSQFSSSENFSKVETTTFYSSFKELGYLDLITLKPSSISSFYKNRFLIRHRFSFLNQWWNGQLAEHNIETTYLSHVDWRSMFVPSIGDLIIDFPDAEQYYNPRSRRWFLQSSSWSYWFDFEQEFRTSIYQH